MCTLIAEVARVAAVFVTRTKIYLKTLGRSTALDTGARASYTWRKLGNTTIPAALGLVKASCIQAGATGEFRQSAAHT